MPNDVAPRQRHLGRVLLPLALLSLAVGISAAVTGPFLSLFLSAEVAATPLRTSVFLAAAPLAGVVASTLAGSLSDRRPIRRKLLIAAALSGLAGTALTAFVRNYWILLGLAVTVTALAGILYPQMYAYARQALADEGSSRTAMAISGLRTTFSVAWVAGPSVAAFMLDLGGFELVYGVASAMYVGAALVCVFLLKEMPAPVAAGSEPVPSEPVPSGPVSSRPVSSKPVSSPDARLSATDPPRWVLLLSSFAFVLFHCPMTLCVQALPMFVQTDLHADISEVGIILGLCAALEIPLMLGLGVLTARIPIRVLLLIGAGCGAVYYLTAAVASQVWVLLAAQIVNAAFIAAITGVGISYMQEMLPGQPGRATTLFTNAFPIGSILAGPLFGLAQHFGYRLAFTTGSVLCAIGLLVLLSVHPTRWRRIQLAAAMPVLSSQPG